MDKCQKCGTRPGTEDWVGDGGTLAMVHGFVQKWCMRCVLEAQIEHCRAAAARLPDLERELSELGD